MAESKMSDLVRNAVVISDLHAGCQLALCPPEGTPLDDGGRYTPSAVQLKLWSWWTEFWEEKVPKCCRNEPYLVILNGDGMDGRHHKAVTQISQNLADQAKLAEAILRPVVDRCDGRFYWIRGTEAHGGPSGQQEEQVAKALCAIADKKGVHSRWELRLRLGFGLIHCAHHIGIAGSVAYETSAIQKELEQIYVEAARWGHEPPDVVIRSHRHRNAETRVRIRKGNRPGFATSCTTSGWQLKTPFAYRVAGARRTQPQIGGTIIRCGDEEIYTRHEIWDLQPEEIEECPLP
jgi:hypothetical protein